MPRTPVSAGPGTQSDRAGADLVDVLSAAGASADREQFASVAEFLPDGLLVADANRCVVVVNGRALKVLGLRREQVIGSDVTQAVQITDRDGCSWWTASKPWTGLATTTGHREQLVLLPDGREVLVTARYLREGRLGPVRAVVMSLRDAAARERIEASNAALISTVAHELRSPLTSVKGFSSTLLKRWERFTDEQKRWMIETIEADADRVTRLIAELLDISRIDSGRIELHVQPVYLESTVTGHIDRMVASGHEQSRFVLQSATNLPEVWADPDRVDQIMANLLENAVRHGDGTVRVGIEVDHTAPTDGETTPRQVVAVTVSDEGDGIAPENYTRVFTRFWQGSRRGGTGLGLYVVRGLVEAHNGQISVGRAPSGGAQFRFTLPVGTPAHLV